MKKFIFICFMLTPNTPNYERQNVCAYLVVQSNFVYFPSGMCSIVADES